MPVAVEQLELCVATFLDTKVPLWCPAKAHLPKGTRASCTPEFRLTMPKIGAATYTSLVEKRVAITYIGTLRRYLVLRYLVVVLPWERFEKLPSAKWLSGIWDPARQSATIQLALLETSAPWAKGVIVRKHPAGQNTWIVGFFLGISTIVQSTVVLGSWLWTV